MSVLCYCFSAPVKGCPTHDPEASLKVSAANKTQAMTNPRPTLLSEDRWRAFIKGIRGK